MNGDALRRSWKIPAPARRALLGAGIETVDDLRRADFDAVARLHGMGPNALARLRAGLDGAA